MHSQDKYIAIGRVGSPHGIHGWLKIISYTEPPENIFDYLPWTLDRRGKRESIEVAETKILGNKLIAQFTKFTVPETARIFTGAEILIPRAHLPTLPAGEYYLSDFEGLNVIDQQGNELGNVLEVMETGSNDVLVVKNNMQTKKRILIPMLWDSVITKVDMENKTIYVNWDEP